MLAHPAISSPPPAKTRRISTTRSALAPSSPSPLSCLSRDLLDTVALTPSGWRPARTVPTYQTTAMLSPGPSRFWSISPGCATSGTGSAALPRPWQTRCRGPAAQGVRGAGRNAFLRRPPQPPCSCGRFGRARTPAHRAQQRRMEVQAGVDRASAVMQATYANAVSNTSMFRFLLLNSTPTRCIGRFKPRYLPAYLFLRS